MMKTRILLSLGLIVVLLAACAPATAATAPTEIAATQVILTEPAVEPSVITTQEVAATPFAVATSRGPELHATDPSTVSLASGQIQLVEFFRFT